MEKDMLEIQSHELSITPQDETHEGLLTKKDKGKRKGISNWSWESTGFEFQSIEDAKLKAKSLDGYSFKQKYTNIKGQLKITYICSFHHQCDAMTRIAKVGNHSYVLERSTVPHSTNISRSGYAGIHPMLRPEFDSLLESVGALRAYNLIKLKAEKENDFNKLVLLPNISQVRNRKHARERSEHATALKRLKGNPPIEERLLELGLTLPPPDTLRDRSYAMVMQGGNLLFTAGHISKHSNGTIVTGKVGVDVSVVDAVQAAEVCILQILATLKAELGSLDKIKQFVKLAGYVNCEKDFDQQSTVLNGASDLLTNIFGERGIHARSAIGVISLSFNACVEIEAIVEVFRENTDPVPSNVQSVQHLMESSV